MSKVAVVQFKASIDKDENLKRIVRYVKQASGRGADLVAFPEFMMFYTQSSQTAAMLASKAETTRGNFLSTIAKAARDNCIEVAGSLYEKVPGRKNRVYDTAFLLSKTGSMMSKYRKVHLYDALGFRESWSNPLQKASYRCTLRYFDIMEPVFESKNGIIYTIFSSRNFFIKRSGHFYALSRAAFAMVERKFPLVVSAFEASIAAVCELCV